MGRFISEDPRGFREGPNFYAYVYNNPINNVDPTGVGALKPLSELLKASKGALDDLSKAAAAPDRNLLTKAGRGLQKHGDRPGSVFPKVSGNNELNQTGQNFVDDILTNPGSGFQRNAKGELQVFDPSGKGVSFHPDGSFRGFLEPPVSSIGSTLLDAGSAILGATIIGVEIVDQIIDPIGNFIFGSEVGDATCASGGCEPLSSQNQFSTPGASGGFVLYPGKPNTNMMQRVYEK